LRAIGIEMPVPFFVIQGRDDHVTPPEPVATYVDDVKAPAKAFALIDGGHYACFTRARRLVSPTGGPCGVELGPTTSYRCRKPEPFASGSPPVDARARRGAANS
jgi:fermentation-respiration switch protein FrsA (DUF1100 family)